ncbi:unnamed protein product [Lactuca saligna]|uniref:NAB domain-containing protein n=1 Tax=Lactuca saligna TaxID=75948 RepID=A0AA35Z9Q1_LACSI|nr:unnamed protein product [Lactuca saligna]
MDSYVGKSHKGYRRTESRNKHSWWWDSHISPKNSKWLAENVEEMDQSVKRMLKLIEEEGDSFAKKAEMYYQKRPQLVSHVEEFYRMYRSLAERYDNVTGELRKNIPSDLQSQGSGVSDVSSEPPLGSNSNSNPQRGSRSGTRTRAAGFDVFLKSGGSSSDLGTKEGDETSTLDSESESDDSSVNNYPIPLESEVRNKNDHVEEELRVANEKIRELTTELQKYESLPPPPPPPPPPQHSDSVGGIVNAGLEEQERKIKSLEIDLKVTKQKVLESEEEVKRLRHELQNNAAQKEISSWKLKFEKEKREVAKMNGRVTRYKENLSERDREIRAMRETLSNANKTLSEENFQLEEQVTKLLKERALLEDVIKEWDLRCQCSEEELRRLKIVNTGMESEIEELKSKVSELDELVVSKDAEIEGLCGHLRELHLEHVELVDGIEKSKKSIEELRCRGMELEREIERQRELIEEGGEEKREVIRQLCFSLEHYRDGYQMLRQAFTSQNKRHLVMT